MSEIPKNEDLGVALNESEITLIQQALILANAGKVEKFKTLINPLDETTKDRIKRELMAGLEIIEENHLNKLIRSLNSQNEQGKRKYARLLRNARSCVEVLDPLPLQERASRFLRRNKLYVKAFAIAMGLLVLDISINNNKVNQPTVEQCAPTRESFEYFLNAAEATPAKLEEILKREDPSLEITYLNKNTLIIRGKNVSKNAKIKAVFCKIGPFIEMVSPNPDTIWVKINHYI